MIPHTRGFMTVPAKSMAIDIDAEYSQNQFSPEHDSCILASEQHEAENFNSNLGEHDSARARFRIRQTPNLKRNNKHLVERIGDASNLQHTLNGTRQYSLYRREMGVGEW